MPNAFYGLAGGRRKESFEKSGEKQMQLIIPQSFTSLTIDRQIVRQGEDQICYHMPETSSFANAVSEPKEHKQIYFNVPVNNNDNSEMIDSVKVQE